MSKEKRKQFADQLDWKGQKKKQDEIVENVVNHVQNDVDAIIKWENGKKVEEIIEGVKKILRPEEITQKEER